MISIAEVITDVRRAVNEFTLNNESIAFDADMEDRASSNFSDEDIADRALDTARAIAARVRAAHLTDPAVTYSTTGRSGLVQVINPTVKAQMTPPGDNNTAEYPFTRLLASRVLLDSATADRRSMNAHIMSSGLEPTVSKPVFVYSDHEFVMATSNTKSTSSHPPGALPTLDPWDGTGADPGTAKASVVMVPMFVNDATVVGAVGDIPGMETAGVKWLNSGWESSTLAIPMDSKFYRPIVNGVLSSCYLTIRQPDVAIAYRARMMQEIAEYLHPRYRTEEIPDLTNQ